MENNKSKNAHLALSIIIPVYNTEKFLEKCLDSVVSQLEDDIEVICVNDGSKDSSLSILETYKNFANFKIVTTKNYGLSHARNTGIKEARGDYLIFIDSDDFVESNYFDNIKNIINNSPVELDLIIVGLRKFDSLKNSFAPKENYYLTKSYGIEGLCSPEDLYNHLFEKFGAFFKVIRKSFFLKNHLFYKEGVYFEDVVPHVKAILLSKNIYVSSLTPYYYRFNRDGSIMNSSYDLKKISHIFLYLWTVRSFLKKKGRFSVLEQQYIKFYSQQISFHEARIPPNYMRKLYHIAAKIVRSIL